MAVRTAKQRKQYEYYNALGNISSLRCWVNSKLVNSILPHVKERELRQDLTQIMSDLSLTLTRAEINLRKRYALEHASNQETKISKAKTPKDQDNAKIK